MAASRGKLNRQRAATRHSRRASERAKRPKPRPVKRAAKRASKNALRDFFEHAEDVVLELLATCPDAELGRRVFKPWIDELRWENQESYANGILKRVTDAIESGAKTQGDIHITTGLMKSQIERALKKLQNAGVYDFIRTGGETEMSRGPGRARILHKEGEPMGD